MSDPDKPARDTYNLRTRAQARAQRTDRQTDTPRTDQSVVTTLPETDRQVEVQTDQHTAHQTDYNILPAAPSPHVIPHLSGLTSISSHAPGRLSETSSKLSVDPTVDLIVQGLLLEESGLASTDIYFRGPGEERPVFPGLTLLVTGATSHGAGQEMDPSNPSLVPKTVAESRPPAVDPSLDLAHPTSQTSNLGASHSTRFWDDVEPDTGPEWSSVYSTATTTFPHTQTAGITITCTRSCWHFLPRNVARTARHIGLDYNDLRRTSGVAHGAG